MLAARRIAPRLVVAQTQRRTMGSGPKPEWTGIDAKVRAIFPEDWQLAGAILGGYGSLILLAQLGSAMKGKPKKETKPVTPAAAPATTTGIPDMESPDFEKYIESDAFTKLIESEDQLSALLADK